MSRPVLWPAARLALNLMLVSAGIALVAWIAVQLRLVVIPVIAAILAATLLVPVADALRSRRVPSVLATLAAMAAAGVVVGAAGWLIAPSVADQLDDLGREAREGVDEALRWLAQGPLDVQQADIERTVDRTVERLRENSGPLARGIVSGATLVAEVIAGFLLWLILTFFFVHDGRRLWRWLLGLLPAGARADGVVVGERAWDAMSGYMRGVVIIALVDAVLIGLALLIIGVPLVLPLAVLTFFGAFLPLVGAVLAGTVAALVALVTEGVVAAVLVVAVITAIQQVEGDLLYPFIVGKAISLHPVAILLVLTAGTVVAGIIGAVVAVPIAAAVWAGVDHLRRRPEPG